MHFKIVQPNQTAVVDPSWMQLYQYVQKHPFCTFEKLKFVNGNPDWGETDLKVKESIKF